LCVYPSAWSAGGTSARVSGNVSSRKFETSECRP
jgi:hypothetical protein